MKKRSWLSVILASSLLMACESVVEFDIPSDEHKVVVEGSIEKDGYPIVLLSSTIGFFDTIGIDTYAEAFLHDAVVQVSDGVDTVQLKEYAIESGGLSFYLYTIDTSDVGALSFKGAVGKTYHLHIDYAGKNYSAITTIPENTMRIDSLWSKPPENEAALSHNPNYRTVHAQYYDGPLKGEYIRLFNSINGGPFLAPYFSVADDDIINGTSVEIVVSKGLNKMNNERDDSEPYRYYYHVGDTVVLKLSSIDKNSYEFYKTLEFSYSAVGNPFATPIVVTTNIQGGALGVWAGYNPMYFSYIVK